MDFEFLGRRPVRVLSPRQGRPNWATLSERALFRKFWSISQTLIPVILGLQNFPGPLALRIWNYMQKSWNWKLLSEILRQDREISSFLWNNFPQIRLALFARLHPALCLEKYCCTTEKAISVSTSHIWFIPRGEDPSWIWAPGRAAQIEQLARREHFFENFDDFGSWPGPIPTYRFF